jgi:excisionase family DNA binding protein
MDALTPRKISYRPKEVAAVTGIGITRIREHIASGRLKSSRIGKCIVVTEESIREFLAAAASGGAR